MGKALHPVVVEAAQGRLPDWTRMSKSRRRHADRVAELMDAWATEFGLGEKDRQRWIAAALLHDALKEEDPEKLRSMVRKRHRGLPATVLHGPAVARLLEKLGVEDRALLNAVAWHTLGHRKLRRIGRALYAADFLEPGRRMRRKWRARLRERMPSEMDDVVYEVLKARIIHMVKRDRTLHRETVGFWNHIAGGES